MTAPAAPDVVAAAMRSADEVAHTHDMSVDHVGADCATVSMTVTAEMANGLGVCHGGLVFTLADTAMAYASNAGDERTMSTTATIDWLRPARVGARLTATSTLTAARGRNAIHDIVVTDESGAVVALVRGQTLRIGGRITEAVDPAPGTGGEPAATEGAT